MDHELALKVADRGDGQLLRATPSVMTASRLACTKPKGVKNSPPQKPVDLALQSGHSPPPSSEMNSTPTVDSAPTVSVCSCSGEHRAAERPAPPAGRPE